MTLTDLPAEQELRPTEVPPEVPKVLFREARARRIRRRAAAAVLAIVAVAVAVVLGLVPSVPSKTDHLSWTPLGKASPLLTAVLPSSINGAAWVDYSGNLHLGQLGAGNQRIVTHAGASATTPLVAIGRSIFWVRTPTAPLLSSGHPQSTVVELDIASGIIKRVARGQAIFPSTDGRDLFIVKSSTSLVEIPVRPGNPKRTFVIPTGWYLNAGGGYANPIAVANGIVVQSSPGQSGRTPPTAAIWNPNASTIFRLGLDQGLIGSYTPAGAAYSLLAWVPGACETNPRCSLLVTNTRTRVSTRIHSPLPYGFDVGGVFSPSGDKLAVFLKTNSGLYSPATQLAIANVQTGDVRQVSGAFGEIGESVGWARWIPNTSTLIAGTFSTNYTKYNHYLVDSRTLTSRLLDFSDNNDLDINFSSVVVPRH
jgi:hypothetical protein